MRVLRLDAEKNQVELTAHLFRQCRPHGNALLAGCRFDQKSVLINRVYVLGHDIDQQYVFSRRRDARTHDSANCTAAPDCTFQFTAPALCVRPFAIYSGLARNVNLYVTPSVLC